MSRKAEGETDESEEQDIMEVPTGDAFAGSEHLTVIGRRLLPGETAPDFCLNYLDLVDNDGQEEAHTLMKRSSTLIFRVY